MGGQKYYAVVVPLVARPLLALSLRHKFVPLALQPVWHPPPRLAQEHSRVLLSETYPHHLQRTLRLHHFAPRAATSNPRDPAAVISGVIPMYE